MAREPYRTRMLEALLSGPIDVQLRKVVEFVVDEAGSSHSDVVAAMNAEELAKRFEASAYLAMLRHNEAVGHEQRRRLVTGEILSGGTTESVEFTCDRYGEVKGSAAPFGQTVIGGQEILMFPFELGRGLWGRMGRPERIRITVEPVDA